MFIFILKRRMDMKVRIYMGAVRRFFLKRRLLKKMNFSLRKSHGMQYFQRHIEDHNKTEIKKIVKFCQHINGQPTYGLTE